MPRTHKQSLADTVVAYELLGLINVGRPGAILRKESVRLGIADKSSHNLSADQYGSSYRQRLGGLFGGVGKAFQNAESKPWFRVQKEPVLFRSGIRRKNYQVICGPKLNEQEAFSKVFAKRKDYQPSSKFSTWLWRIALNLCYDELRRRQRIAKHLIDSGLEEPHLSAPEFTSEQPGPDLRLVRQEENDPLHQPTHCQRSVGYTGIFGRAVFGVIANALLVCLAVLGVGAFMRLGSQLQELTAQQQAPARISFEAATARLRRSLRMKLTGHYSEASIVATRTTKWMC